ncbi:unnamed protein product [Arctia plantaginis]|uniref:MADF domain-containing protein n=1 Tax=Arctia plantaginis TaxID=874455 RepID=A0A8S0ZRR9_ARCPL|nr:unnamed protein product [Arctia plantaginis]
MEWSKEKTLKLIELLQVNATLWNPSLCDTRRVKHFCLTRHVAHKVRLCREQIRVIAEILTISVPDVTEKIQHLRTQYKRESAREARAYVEDPNDRYVSNWYAFDCLHFLKDSSRPYRIVRSEENSEINGVPPHSDNAPNPCKLSSPSPPHKIPRFSEPLHSVSPDVICPRNRDEFSVFGEYIANELRSLKEMNPHSLKLYIHLMRMKMSKLMPIFRICGRGCEYP